MTWAVFHTKAQDLASQAGVARKSGESDRARRLYRDAAELEERALSELDPSMARTLAVTAVSAASLYFKASAHAEAERLAHRCLADAQLPEFGRHELQEILQNVWAERIRAQANVHFSPGQVLVSVKGGDVVVGGAPLDLIVQKVEGIQSLFLRTAEFLKKLPHRTRGGPTKDVQDLCRPWLFQAAPGSYQFAVAVEEPKQMDLFPSGNITGEQISSTFLAVLRAMVVDPEHGLDVLVPDPGYRQTFLKLARNLAPTGKAFTEMQIRRAGEDQEAICLSPDVRKILHEASRSAKDLHAFEEKRETIHGILRAVHLDKDWLEVAVDSNQKHVHVVNVGDAVDDVIGPMVNHAVEVEVVIDAQGRRVLRNIQQEE